MWTYKRRSQQLEHQTQWVKRLSIGPIRKCKCLLINMQSTAALSAQLWQFLQMEQIYISHFRVIFTHFTLQTSSLSCLAGNDKSAILLSTVFQRMFHRTSVSKQNNRFCPTLSLWPPNLWSQESCISCICMVHPVVLEFDSNVAELLHHVSTYCFLLVPIKHK